MLIGLIISAIIALTGGDESEFVSSIPHIKREIRRHVLEDARKDSLLVLVKAYEKEIKKYEKGKDKLQKNLYKTSSDRSKSTDEFLEAYDAYYQATVSLISSLIDYRLLFQQQVTEEELQLIAEKAMESSKKEQRQLAKGEEKIKEHLQDSFKDIHKVVNKHVDDPAKADTITKNLDDLENTVYEFIDEALELNMEKKRLLDDKNASGEELHELYERSSDLRFQGSRNYAHFREEAIRHTNEREWKAINKELKSFLKD